MASCEKKDDKPTGSYLGGQGVFIINEGNFMGGNGSLSFYSYDSSAVFNDLFFNINGRPLGDVPNSIEIYGEKIYVVVNNSGKIEVLDKSTLESVATISGLISPRNIAFVSSSRAYVTSMYSDSLAVIDLDASAISGYINLRRSSESIIIAGAKAFIANWIGGDEIMVVDTSADTVIDSVKVGVEPESMVLDRNNIIWVLCNGGWMRENFAELLSIDPATSQIIKRLVFSTMEESPSCLKIDGNGETLYYLSNGIKRMDINTSILPEEPFIAQSDHFFYKMGINPYNDEIFVTDAVDYQQNGYIMRYNASGTLIKSHQTAVIPGAMCFKKD